jgi:hypothetical protein
LLRNYPFSRMAGRPSSARTTVKDMGSNKPSTASQMKHSPLSDVNICTPHKAFTSTTKGFTKHKTLGPYFISGRTCVQTLGAENLRTDFHEFPQLLQAKVRTVP